MLCFKACPISGRCEEYWPSSNETKVTIAGRSGVSCLKHKANVSAVEPEKGDGHLGSGAG